MKLRSTCYFMQSKFPDKCNTRTFHTLPNGQGQFHRLYLTIYLEVLESCQADLTPFFLRLLDHATYIFPPFIIRMKASPISRVRVSEYSIETRRYIFLNKSFLLKRGSYSRNESDLLLPYERVASHLSKLSAKSPNCKQNMPLIMQCGSTIGK